jgi:hypothetical protein
LAVFLSGLGSKRSSRPLTVNVIVGIHVPIIPSMNKTIYIRDEDASLWEKAKELAGDKLSPVIVTGLRRFVVDVETSARGFDRIEVRFNDSDDSHIPRAKAFYGRWIYSPDEPFEESDDENVPCARYAVAITAKGSAVVYWWRTGAGGGKWAEKFWTFTSLDQAAKNHYVNNAVRNAITKMGVPVEELNI